MVLVCRDVASAVGCVVVPGPTEVSLVDKCSFRLFSVLPRSDLSRRKMAHEGLVLFSHEVLPLVCLAIRTVHCRVLQCGRPDTQAHFKLYSKTKGRWWDKAGVHSRRMPIQGNRMRTPGRRRKSW